MVKNKIPKENKIKEFVDSDGSLIDGDRNAVNNSEIETGPVEKPYDDNSDYQKGVATTGDRVFGRYRQNIPWFAVYSYGGVRSNGTIRENKNVVIKKKTVEEKIEDLVKKSKSSEVTDKNYNPKIAKIIDTIYDAELTDSQIEELKKALENKKLDINKPKNI
jgi:hypothetical protein